MTGSHDGVDVRPLERRDPPALGDVTLTGRLHVSDAGIVYAGEVASQPVAVVMLGAGAEADSYARARFSDAVDELRATRSEDVVATDVEPEIAPWVAVRAPDWEHGLATSRTLLAPVTLEHVGPVGRVSGPGFRPHWFQRHGVGRWRMWPLPWPVSLTAAARWTYLASFGLILAISAIALWIAVKIFDDQGPAPVPPPFPQPIPSPTDGSPSPTPTPSPTGPTQPPTPTDTGPTGTTDVPPII